MTKQVHVASTATINSDCEDTNLSDDDDNDKSLCEAMDFLASNYRVPLRVL